MFSAVSGAWNDYIIGVLQQWHRSTAKLGSVFPILTLGFPPCLDETVAPLGQNDKHDIIMAAGLVRGTLELCLI